MYLPHFLTLQVSILARQLRFNSHGVGKCIPHSILVEIVQSTDSNNSARLHLKQNLWAKLQHSLMLKHKKLHHAGLRGVR